MAKMYILDNKLLIGTPEIRIGDVIISVDDREKTVKKVMALVDSAENKRDTDVIDSVLKTVLSAENFKKIDGMNMPWSAYSELMNIVMSALTGSDYKYEGSAEDNSSPITASK